MAADLTPPGGWPFARGGAVRDPGDILAQKRRSQLAVGKQAKQGSSLLQDAVTASLGRTAPVTRKERTDFQKRQEKKLGA